MPLTCFIQKLTIIRNQRSPAVGRANQLRTRQKVLPSLEGQARTLRKARISIPQHRKRREKSTRIGSWNDEFKLSSHPRKRTELQKRSQISWNLRRKANQHRWGYFPQEETQRKRGEIQLIVDPIRHPQRAEIKILIHADRIVVQIEVSPRLQQQHPQVKIINHKKRSLKKPRNHWPLKLPQRTQTSTPAMRINQKQI